MRTAIKWLKEMA